MKKNLFFLLLALIFLNIPLRGQTVQDIIVPNNTTSNAPGGTSSISNTLYVGTPDEINSNSLYCFDAAGLTVSNFFIAYNQTGGSNNGIIVNNQSYLNSLSASETIIGCLDYSGCTTSNNYLLVEANSTVTNSGPLYLGYNDQGNDQITITGNSSFDNPSQSNIYIGYALPTSNNIFSVLDASSVTNHGTIYLGGGYPSSPDCGYNQIIVSGASTFVSYGWVVLGGSANNSPNNTLTISGSGTSFDILSPSSLQINGTGNTVYVINGAILNIQGEIIIGGTNTSGSSDYTDYLYISNNAQINCTSGVVVGTTNKSGNGPSIGYLYIQDGSVLNPEDADLLIQNGSVYMDNSSCVTNVQLVFDSDSNGASGYLILPDQPLVVESLAFYQDGNIVNILPGTQYLEVTGQLNSYGSGSAAGNRLTIELATNYSLNNNSQTVIQCSAASNYTAATNYTIAGITVASTSPDIFTIDSGNVDLSIPTTASFTLANASFTLSDGFQYINTWIMTSTFTASDVTIDGTVLVASNNCYATFNNLYFTNSGYLDVIAGTVNVDNGLVLTNDYNALNISGGTFTVWGGFTMSNAITGTNLIISNGATVNVTNVYLSQASKSTNTIFVTGSTINCSGTMQIGNLGTATNTTVTVTITYPTLDPNTTNYITNTIITPTGASVNTTVTTSSTTTNNPNINSSTTATTNTSTVTTLNYPGSVNLTLNNSTLNALTGAIDIGYPGSNNILSLTNYSTLNVLNIAVGGYIGANNSQLLVEDSTCNATNIFLGYHGANSNLSLFSNATLHISSNLYVGYSNEIANSMTLLDSTIATITNGVIIGLGQGSSTTDGTVGSVNACSNTLTVNSSTLSIRDASVAPANYSLVVGCYGYNNALIITNGGSVSSSLALLGSNALSSNNSAVVTGSNSSGTYSVWNNSNGFYVGFLGAKNSLVISNGGSVVEYNGTYPSYSYVGLGSSGNSVVVTGSNSIFSNQGALNVGYFGNNNSVLLTNYGKLVDSNVINTFTYAAALGVYSNGNSVTIGTNSSWTNYGDLYIGYKGSSNKVTNNGGALFATNIYIGISTGTNNALVMNGGTLIASNLTIGSNSSLTVNTNSTITLSGAITNYGYLYNSGSITAASFTNVNNGTNTGNSITISTSSATTSATTSAN